MGNGCKLAGEIERFERFFVVPLSFLIIFGDTRSSLFVLPMEKVPFIGGGVLLLFSGEVCVPVWVNLRGLTSESVVFARLLGV